MSLLATDQNRMPEVRICQDTENFISRTIKQHTNLMSRHLHVKHKSIYCQLQSDLNVLYRTMESDDSFEQTVQTENKLLAEIPSTIRKKKGKTEYILQVTYVTYIVDQVHKNHRQTKKWDDRTKILTDEQCGVYEGGCSDK